MNNLSHCCAVLRQITLSVLFLIFCIAYSSGQVTAYTGFESPDIGSDIGGDVGGEGFLSGWEVFSSGQSFLITDGSLEFGDLIITGNKVSHNFNSTFFDDRSRNISPIGDDGTTQYISFLIRPEGTLGEGEFNGYLGLDLRGNLGSAFFGKPGADDLNNYVVEEVAGANQVSTSIPVVINETALIIVKIDFNAGNDDISMFVNPDPNSPEPVADAINSNLNLGIVNSLFLNASGSYSIDEIRLGGSYDAVTPTNSKLIPTMGQWTLMILGLLLTTMAIVVIKRGSSIPA